MAKSSTNAQVYIYDSEYNAIVSAAKEFLDIETGGDLFGSFSHGAMPVIWLASGPGPKVHRSSTHFEQDTTFTTAWQQYLNETFGIQYIGSWHSHHRLNLREPSSGDIRSAQTYARRHGRDRTLEIIVNHEGRETVLRPYFYPNAQREGWVRTGFVRLPGESPVRVQLAGDWIKNRLPAFASGIRDSAEREDGLSPSPTPRTRIALPIELSEEIQSIANDVDSVEAEINDNICMLIMRLLNHGIVAVAVNVPNLTVLQVNLIGQNNVDISGLLQQEGIPFTIRRRGAPVLRNILKMLPRVQHYLEAEQRRSIEQQNLENEQQRLQLLAAQNMKNDPSVSQRERNGAYTNNALVSTQNSPINVAGQEIQEEEAKLEIIREELRKQLESGWTSYDSIQIMHTLNRLEAKLPISEDKFFILATRDLDSHQVVAIYYVDGSQKRPVDISSILHDSDICLPDQQKRPDGETSSHWWHTVTTTLQRLLKPSAD